MSAFQPLSARGPLTNRNVFGISWHSVQRVYVLQWVTHEGVKQLHIKYFRVLAILIERHFTAPTGNLMFATNCHEFFGLPFGIGKRDSVCWAGYTTAFQYIYIYWCEECAWLELRASEWKLEWNRNGNVCRHYGITLEDNA